MNCLKKYQKYITKIKEWYIICFMTFLLLSRMVCFVTLVSSKVNAACYVICAIIGGLLLIADLVVNYRMYLRLEYYLFAAFLGVCLISSFVYREYGISDNIKTIVWMAIQLFLLSSVVTFGRQEEISGRQCLKRLMKSIVVVQSIGVIISFGQFLVQSRYIIPDYNGAISVSAQKTDIILVDSGHSMRELENDKDIMDIAVENYAYIEVCVTGKHICEENKRLRKLKEDRVYMLNLVSATQFYELTDMLKGKKCYREPCIYDWCEDNPIFDETMNDFLQDNLSELWEDCRPDRLKECIGRLYEKISSIRYFKGVKKKKSR